MYVRMHAPYVEAEVILVHTYIHTYTRRGKRLLSCGADKCCIFRTIDHSKRGEALCVSNVVRQSVSGGTVFDMAVDATGRNAVTGGQDKLLSVWDTETATRKKRYVMFFSCM